MKLSRNKLYAIIFISCLAGYIWLYYVLTKNNATNPSIEACFIKNTLNIPCPSCGATRSILSLIKGNFTKAFFTNPLGYIIATIMVLAPLWIIYDVISQKNTFFLFYQKIELYLRKPKYAMPLIFLLIINWVWNITKEL